jgi:hypothetical protein
VGRAGSSRQVLLLIFSSPSANLIETRCIEHTIHLGAAAFVKAMGPKMKNWTKNRTASVEDTDDEDDDDEEWAADWNRLNVILIRKSLTRRLILSQVIRWVRLSLS